MNVDGSFLKEWIMGFSFNLEAQCQLETEIKAIREGIINNVGERIGDQAPNCGGDAKEVIEAINKKSSVPVGCYMLREIEELMEEDWEVRVEHCYRESNRSMCRCDGQDKLKA